MQTSLIQEKCEVWIRKLAADSSNHLLH
jgi:hypothetical protein